MDGIFALVAFVSGFVIAQFWKLIEGLARRKKRPEMDHFKTAIAYIFRSGGMPSGHSACMSAITIYFGLAEGINSNIFALALASATIVIYDALHVRHAVGEQGKALNRLLSQNHDTTLPVVEGHIMTEVVVGVILGGLVGFLVYILQG